MGRRILFGILAAMSDALVGAAMVAPEAARAAYDITVADPTGLPHPTVLPHPAGRSPRPVGRTPRGVGHAVDIRTFEQELKHGRV
jgi:hypothetical protein